MLSYKVFAITADADVILTMKTFLRTSFTIWKLYLECRLTDVMVIVYYILFNIFKCIICLISNNIVQFSNKDRKSDSIQSIHKCLYCILLKTISNDTTWKKTVKIILLLYVRWIANRNINLNSLLRSKCFFVQNNWKLCLRLMWIRWIGRCNRKSLQQSLCSPTFSPIKT